MTARQTIRAKWNHLRQQAEKSGQVRLSASALTLWAEVAIHLLLAAVLAGAVIREHCAPFGVAMVGAAGSGLCGLGALVGACFGSLVTLDLSEGLRYASAAILTISVSFAFYDWRPIRRPWVMPAIAGTVNGFTGFIAVSRSGWTPLDVVDFLLELILTAGATWATTRTLGS